LYILHATDENNNVTVKVSKHVTAFDLPNTIIIHVDMIWEQSMANTNEPGAVLGQRNSSSEQTQKTHTQAGHFI